MDVDDVDSISDGLSDEDEHPGEDEPFFSDGGQDDMNFHRQQKKWGFAGGKDARSL